MTKTIKDLVFLVIITIAITLTIWLPHLIKTPNFYGLNFSNGFNTIYRNYDGLEYVVIAKSLYFPNLIKALPQTKEPIYYASHFPGYPFFILLFSPILGFLKSMLFVSLLFTILSCWVFYLLIKDFKLSNHPLWLSTLFLILPARFVIVHSVGTPEPLFIFSIITSLYFFMKYERDKATSCLWLSAIFGLLAQITRPPATLLLLALMIYIHWDFLVNKTKSIGFKKAFFNHLKYFPLVLIPLSLLGIFYLYQNSYGDFWAYFHSGDNIHLTFPPFQVFNKNQFWVGDIWLEDIIYLFLIGLSAGLMLFKKKLYPLGFFVLTYLTASLFIAHRDISRYTLPVMPFVIIAFEKFLSSKEFKIVMVILGLGIYLYAQNFILNNTAPIPNLSLFN